MPIRERTAKKCVDVFTDHISGLIADTVPTKSPIHSWRPNDDFAILGFREGAPTAVPLETNLGTLHLYVSQAVDAVREGRNKYRLRTLRYWYRVQEEPDPTTQALVRWEYDRDTDHARHARHHMQLPATLEAGNGTLDLNKAHLPTGWVTIEEVIRFLIVDLDMQPPCGDDWPAKLRVSEDAFFQKFTGKREPALPK